MDESKIDLTERLRREGRWAEASKFKDETVKKLRKEGLKRAEAGEQAWRKMAEAYPPLPAAEPIPETAAEDEQATDLAEDELTQLVCDAAEAEVERWQEKYCRFRPGRGPLSRPVGAGSAVARWGARCNTAGLVPRVGEMGDR
ncbi:MAG: hypothetical protein HQ581_08915 [Planctomycetes bacterium]|nr:hypothetical protein [Planctomycetota bacterium]